MSDHDPVGAQPYLDALAEALADGRLTKEKTRRLGRIAGRAGMGAAQVAELHRRFLDGLRDAALADDYMTPQELEALTTTAFLLDVPEAFSDITLQGRVEPLSGPRIWCAPSVPASVRGKLQEAGYRIVFNVSRGLAAAVVGTQEEGLPKARKAGELGVPVVAVSAVNGLLGEHELPAPVAPAGWYADPTARFIYRYWTGQSWTQHASPGDGSTVTDPL
jgi:DNA polymerase-3 subunit epsilon